MWNFGRFTINNDLHQIRGDAMGQMKAAIELFLNPKDAPPINRTPPVSVVSLTRGDDHLGTFVVEHFELAQANSLPAQAQHAIWNNLPEETRGALEDQPFYNTLFKPNGVMKTPFELALLPYDHTKPKSRLKVIEYLHLVHADIKAHNDSVRAGGPGSIINLPAVYDKYLVPGDYFKELIENTNIKVKDLDRFTINVRNPAEKTTLFERALHWGAQRISLLMTLGAALTAVTFSLISLPVAAVAVIGTFLAKWCINEFSTFDLAESLYREYDWISSEKFREGKVISAKKLLRTSLLFAAILSGVGAAMVGGWALGMAAIPELGMAFSLIQYSVAGLLALTAGFSTITGGISTQRFFWGASIWDNQIRMNQEAVDQLPALEKPLVVPEAAKAEVDGIKEGFRIEKRALKAQLEALKGRKKETIRSFLEDFNVQSGETEEASAEAEKTHATALDLPATQPDPLLFMAAEARSTPDHASNDEQVKETADAKVVHLPKNK